MTCEASRHGPLPSAEPERDLAGALHDVSNSLTLVVGWLERVRDQLDVTSPLRHALDVAYDRALQGRAIARRAVGAPTAGDNDARSLAALIDDAVTGVTPAISAKGLLVRTEVDGGAAIVQGAHAVTQVLTNLLLNATAFSPVGGLVRLEVRVDDAGAEVRVGDQGPGVAADQRARLFTRGQSTRDGGAGIGLAHASALARAYGGALACEDAAPGATFVLRWPVVGTSDAILDVPTPTPSVRVRNVLRGRRVLVVEDDDAVMMLLDTALSSRGATVVCVTSARGLNGVIAQSPPFDAALVDLSPLGDDPDAHLASLARHSPAARLVVMSGTEPPAGALAGLPFRFVRKPFELVEIVDALIAQHSP